MQRNRSGATHRLPINVQCHRVCATVAGIALLVAGCSKKADTSSSVNPASSLPGRSTPVPPSVAGSTALPEAKIPKGKLVSGVACWDQPRRPDQEMTGESLDMEEFSIDVYPYPNDPAQLPKTGVAQQQAEKLCEARGRRLCTELEWERACKGPSNTKYEYGDRFDAKKCPAGTEKLAPLGSYPSCKSGFGVEAMHGIVWEWTSSAWGRGKQDGDWVAQRGGFGNAPYAHLRCASARSAAPTDQGDRVGFRCCGGPQNSARVTVAIDTADGSSPAVLEQVTDVNAELLNKLRQALKHGHVTEQSGYSYAFDKVWRWRPVANAELYLAFWSATSQSTKTKQVQIIATQFCPAANQLLARLSRPVDDVAAPEVSTEPTRGGPVGGLQPDLPVVSFPAKLGADSGNIKFGYVYGQVSVSPPPWLKSAPAATAPSASNAKK